MEITKIFIGGEWRNGSGAEFTTYNPVNGDINATINAASDVDLEDAIKAAKIALNNPEWRDMLPMNRAKILHKIGDTIEAHADEISRIQTMDTGKTRTETKALALSAAGTFRYMAACLDSMDYELTSPRGNYFTMSIYEPMGIVGAIVPWNSPIASDAQKLAPALAAGNAVILKPAEWTPLVSLYLAKLCEEAGLAKGLLSVLPGKGSVIGDAIVKHPEIKKISFTGGTSTGKIIAKAAAEKFMPVSLELGGKSPVMVCEDAEFDIAINAIMFGIFSSTGQSCIAGSRVFIHKNIYQEFIEKLVEKTKKLRIGNPQSASTQVSSLVSFEHRKKVLEYIELAKKEGGKILCGGAAPTNSPLDKGAYIMPTIIEGLNNNCRTCREEIFGPVLVVMPYETEEEFIKLANDNEYGLASGIFTPNYKTAYRVARAIDTGTVWINTYKQFSIATPFGGTKNSGMGREKGRNNILGYMNQKSLYWGTSDIPMAWSD